MNKSYFERLAEARIPKRSGMIDLHEMLDPNYLEADLPDDFMYNRISRMFKDDPEIKVLRKEIAYNGEELSRVCAVNMNTEFIDIGPKEIKPPIYLPKEDFRSVDLMLDWFDGYRDGRVDELPDLPAPQPIIPENQYFKPQHDYYVENFFNHKGAVIVDPGLGLQGSGIDMNVCKLHDKSGLPTMEELEEQNESIQKKLIPEGQEEQNAIEPLIYFFPYKDIQEEDLGRMQKRNYVSMQYNPFHPMAVHFLEEYRWDDTGTVITGTYTYRGKKKRFKYDINDQRYRIHSHVWLQIAKGYKFCGFMEVFDLVGNFPFNDKMKLIMKDIYVEPLMIEPLAPVHRLIIPEKPYSYIGGGNYYKRGINQYAVCPYANFIMEDQDLDVVWAIDVTDQVEMFKDAVKIHDYFIPIKKKEIQSDNFFLKYYDKDRFKIYEQVLFKGEPNYGMFEYSTSFKNYFIRSENHEKFIREFVEEDKDRAFKFKFTPLKFYSFPRNRIGSIVMDFRAITIHEAVEMDSSTLHEYWPFLVPFTDDMEEDQLHDYSQGCGEKLEVFEWVEHPECISFKTIVY